MNNQLFKMEEIIRAMDLKKQLNLLRALDIAQEGRIMQKFRLDWNYHSNNLEGNSLTYGETKALIMYGLTAQGKPLKDHSEIKGHNDAINWIEEVVKGDRPLTENFIRELHTLLLVEPYEVDAITPDGQPTKKRIKVGAYKSLPNHVETKTGEIFYFSTPEETPAEMAALMHWYNEKIEVPDFNPILLAAEFHYKFIRIHPFDDGNGRTARLLMNFILMRSGYPPVIIKTEDKANYFAVLQLADSGNLEAFVEYIAQNLNRSLEIMIAGAKGEDIEEPDDIDKEIALLERRLSTYGKEIEKEKNPANINEIYINSIYPLTENIKLKFEPLEKYYLRSNVYIQIDGEQYSWPTLPTKLFKSVNGIIIGIFFQQFKKSGLENHSFSFNYVIEFHILNYTIGKSNEQPIISKNYENISNKELSYLIEKIFVEYKKDMESILK